MIRSLVGAEPALRLENYVFASLKLLQRCVSPTRPPPPPARVSLAGDLYRLFTANQSSEGAFGYVRSAAAALPAVLSAGGKWPLDGPFCHRR